MSENISERQKELYEKIHEIYKAHYYDKYSMEYRRKYIYDFFLKQRNLNGFKVADLASGAGDNIVEFLKVYPEAIPTGFDISDKACADYEKTTGFQSYQMDLTQDITIEEQFDVAIIVGGLHHCVSDLEKTLQNIAKLLKKDGLLMFMEPNADYFLEKLRKRWYKKDTAFFDDLTEHALSYPELKKMTPHLFEEVEVAYRGGPAYFLVLNSAIFRMPKFLKNLYSGLLIRSEKLFNKILPSYFSAYFIACWRRK